jgi:hypothetical protein
MTTHRILNFCNTPTTPSRRKTLLQVHGCRDTLVLCCGTKITSGNFFCYLSIQGRDQHALMMGKNFDVTIEFSEVVSKQSGGTIICENNLIRIVYKEFDGTSICEDNHHRSVYKQCGGSSIYERNRITESCASNETGQASVSTTSSEARANNVSVGSSVSTTT